MTLRPLMAWVLLFALAALPGEALAQDEVTTYTTDNQYDIVAGDLEDAIINRGFVVNDHSDIAAMLDRTADAVGASKKVYLGAEVFEFCSAVLSRAMMEADSANIAYCPLAVFVYEAEDKPGTVTVGFRRLPTGKNRDALNDLLDEIVREAAGQF